MSDDDEDIVTGMPTDLGKSLGSRDLKETFGRSLGFPNKTEATQGADSVGDFDPTSYLIDSMGIMQAAPASDSSTNSDSGNQPANPVDLPQPQDSK